MNKKTMSSERKMTNAEGLHSRHGVLTRRMARELCLKKEEVREDKMEEELKKKDEEEDEKKEKTQEGVEAKEPTVTESPDQNADGVNSAAAAEDVPVRPQPPPAVETSEEDMASVLNLSQYGWTPWRSKEEQYLWFDGDFSSGLGNPYGDFFDNPSFPSVNNDDAGDDLGHNNAWDGSFWNFGDNSSPKPWPSFTLDLWLDDCSLLLLFLMKFSVRPFDHRDEALFQMMCILRMMASIFYRIDDLPDYLIVSQQKETHLGEEVQRGRSTQLIKTNGKRASNEGGEWKESFKQGRKQK
ncbi:hypothetical protein ACFX2I_047049 [Malus domestica]